MKRLVPRPGVLERMPSGQGSWGDGHLTLALPGGAVRIEGLSPLQSRALLPRFGPWRTSGSETLAASVRVERVAETAFAERTVRGETSSLERRAEVGRVRFAGLELLGEIELSDRDAGLRARLLTPVDGAEHGTADPRFLDAFENLLRTLVAYRSLAVGGVLLHSSGVLTPEGVHLFIGPSGAGKTTVARFACELGLPVLSDDINVLLPSAGTRFLARRLPFAGELQSSGPGPSPVEGPVVAIHRLRQESRHALRHLSPARRAAALLGSSPFVNADPHRLPLLERRLDVLADLVDELAFCRDAGFWSLLSPSLASCEVTA